MKVSWCPCFFIGSCPNLLGDCYNTRLEEESLPRLWIFSPTASESFLDGFGAKLDIENWLAGVHFFDKYWRGAIVAIHQLPATEQTLWLRLLGKGRVQQQAIEEVQALELNNLLRSKAIDLLMSLKTTLELSQNLDVEDRDLIMQVFNTDVRYQLTLPLRDSSMLGLNHLIYFFQKP